MTHLVSFQPVLRESVGTQLWLRGQDYDPQLEISAFEFDRRGREIDRVYYQNRTSRDGGLVLSPDGQSITIDSAIFDINVESFVLTVASMGLHLPVFRSLDKIECTLRETAESTPAVRIRWEIKPRRTATATVIGHFERRSGNWLRYDSYLQGKAGSVDELYSLARSSLLARSL